MSAQDPPKGPQWALGNLRRQKRRLAINQSTGCRGDTCLTAPASPTFAPVFTDTGGQWARDDSGRAALPTQGTAAKSNRWRPAGMVPPAAASSLPHSSPPTPHPTASRRLGQVRPVLQEEDPAAQEVSTPKPCLCAYLTAQNTRSAGS